MFDKLRRKVRATTVSRRPVTHDQVRAPEGSRRGSTDKPKAVSQISLIVGILSLIAELMSLIIAFLFAVLPFRELPRIRTSVRRF